MPLFNRESGPGWLQAVRGWAKKHDALADSRARDAAARQGGGAGLFVRVRDDEPLPRGSHVPRDARRDRDADLVHACTNVALRSRQAFWPPRAFLSPRYVCRWARVARRGGRKDSQAPLEAAPQMGRETRVRHGTPPRPAASLALRGVRGRRGRPRARPHLSPRVAPAASRRGPPGRWKHDRIWRPWHHVAPQLTRQRGGAGAVAQRRRQLRGGGEVHWRASGCGCVVWRVACGCGVAAHLSSEQHSLMTRSCASKGSRAVAIAYGDGGPMSSGLGVANSW